MMHMVDPSIRKQMAGTTFSYLHRSKQSLLPSVVGSRQVALERSTAGSEQRVRRHRQHHDAANRDQQAVKDVEPDLSFEKVR